MANWRTYIDPSVGDGQNTLDGIIANGPTYGIQISDDLSVTGLSTFSDVARFSGTVRLDGQLRDGDNSFGTSGQVLSSDGTDTRWVNAAQLSAGAAAQIAINADNSSNSNRFITFVDSSSGNNDLKTDTGLTYNPSTNTISASLFSGTIQTAAQTNITSLGTLTGLTVGGNIMPNSDSTRNIGSNSVRFEAGYFDSVFGSGSNLTDLNASNLSTGTVNTARLPITYTKADRVTIQSTGAGNDVLLDAADHIILEAGEEEDGQIFFRGNSGADSYRFAKSGQTAIEGFLSFQSLSDDRTFTFPNADGTIALTSSDITGNAASATILATDREFSISGDITANGIDFDGSNNVALSATIDTGVVDYDNLKASNRTTATNGQYLRKQSGNTGGMTWEDVPVVTGGNLTGNTLASNIVSSSLTSLGTLTGLTVNGNASITGTVNIDNTITLDSKNESPEHDHGVIIIQPSTSGGSTGINFRSKVNSTSDHGYLWWYDDNNNYAGNSSSTENGALVIGIMNDANATTEDAVAIESSGDIFLNPGLTHGNEGGGAGPDFSKGRVYIGRASTKHEVWHAGNDGSGSGLDADKLDGQEGSYYRNAGNLNAGTIPNARFPSTLPTLSGANLTSLNASNISSGTLNTARLPSTYSKAATITIEADGSGKDINLDAGDNIVLDAGVTPETGSIFFRANAGASSYRFSKGGQTSIEGFLSFESISADRTYTFPNKNGTVAMTSDMPTEYTRTRLRSFTSNTTYTPTSGTKSIIVYCIAGGGGGGNASGDDSGEQSDFGAASGGGGGGCSIGQYTLGSGFTAAITIGGGGSGGSSGGESRFNPSSGNTIQGNGGSAGGQATGGGGGSASGSGALNCTGHQGNNRSTSSSGGQYYQTPGNGGVAGYVFGTKGSGGNGGGPTGGQQAGQSGTAGIVVIYEYIST